MEDNLFSVFHDLVLQCHCSYSACGLGSDGTDRLVQLVQEMQHRKISKSGDGSLYGAKITGGGCGGTVCVIGKNCLRSTEQILQVICWFVQEIIKKEKTLKCLLGQ